ncbi:TetR/AcrR family transcriptional regulator [Nocardia sp. CA2R105]|uniref:TetR/AcrR family transcriptional regulator n=1 Tax=Nocardia coffeae TaxID=2873381 RepID=UPI001CA6843D|nr:TetR/AcrR family transcriptional regulator [Nocardia coffeae]MBY8859344.1 TetR/AcrR family transcriptional regulator [Nocardia coffeae]
MPSLTRVTTNRRSQSDQRRREFEAQVLLALERLMSDGTPYTELAVQRIAAASHVARSTFYRHFPDKSQLLIRMADLASQDLFGAAENWWHAEHTDVRHTIAGMRRMIAEFRRHRLVLIALTEVAAYDRDVGRYWRERVQGFQDVICERLITEQRRGRVDRSCDVTATAIVLTSMVERSISTALGEEQSIDDEQLARALGRAIWLVVYGDPERSLPR